MSAATPNDADLIRPSAPKATDQPIGATDPAPPLGAIATEPQTGSAIDAVGANELVPATPKGPRKAARTAAKVRYLAPDVARGIALLGIALANLPTAWIDPQADHAAFFGGYNDPGTWWEKGLVIFHAMFVHVRGLPMFATLLGVGIGMIFASLLKRGYTIRAARGVLARRYAWLLVFGLLHCIFLFSGDIMTGYGFCGLFICLLIGASDKALRITRAVQYGIVATILGISSFGVLWATPEQVKESKHAQVEWSAMATTYLDYIKEGLVAVPFSATLIFLALPFMLTGVIWGRSGVFSDIEGHSRMLWRWVWIGAIVMIGTGLPYGLTAIEVLPKQWGIIFMNLNQTFGWLTGPGILAAVMLAMRPLQRHATAAAERGEDYRPPAWLVPFNELGKRSMSGYLMQSILFFVLTQKFTLNLLEGQLIGVQTLFATAVWATTLLLAWWLGRTGLPGPFEQLHRRLSYGKNGLPESYTPTAKEAAVEEKRLAKIERRAQRKEAKRLAKAQAKSGAPALQTEPSAAHAIESGSDSSSFAPASPPVPQQSPSLSQSPGLASAPTALDSEQSSALSMRNQREEYSGDPQPPSRTDFEGEHRG